MKDYNLIEESAVRQNNRRLRFLNGKLRRQVQENREHADALFYELCDTSPAAEAAMWTIWQEGGFQPPCRPDDYQEIVDTCLRALKLYREEATQPAVCESAT
jgi:hypothetical protein